MRRSYTTCKGSTRRTGRRSHHECEELLASKRAFQKRIHSMLSKAILSPVRSWSRVVWEDSWAAMVRASSSAPPPER